ncbi:MAG: GNAT family N-acetyltransferase [Undibacterium sp.]|uniref:GNAT family N-acetyltransferase n=1 Tax=Undibacterium sp. TaxID=1914977 RepID=UPI00271F9262|nr:GNAT family N-acetyltransferase [Undibacterium sp.]MDO8654557.1 GNAT family N-acetyltransferase [Undibacterium sp.]
MSATARDHRLCASAKKQGAAYLGMFVVRPVLQGAGIGKYFMHVAETHAQPL